MGRSVLIVDDHPGFRVEARDVLEADGWDVVGDVGDGAAALAAASELRPDVVLLDVRLPDATGELAERCPRAPAALDDVVEARFCGSAEATVYYTVAEALVNVGKHAAASRVTVGPPGEVVPARAGLR